MNEARSTPSFTQFDPTIIPFQKRLIRDIDCNLDFSIGTHEILMSGSVGSAKSILAAHIIVKHCLQFPRARVMIGRRSLPDLKDTLFQKLKEHLDDENLVEGDHYTLRENTADIFFKNGSEIISKSWADKKYNKFRSLELSMAVIEEAVENRGDDYKAIGEIRQRVGRLPAIKQNLIIYCTNPDSPEHALYKYFFNTKSPTRHIYFSRTEENPFLPKTYIEQLKRDLSPKEAMRMLEGKWLEIDKERIYYAYNGDLNFIHSSYTIDKRYPIAISFDFNIGVGKPMSAIAGQYHNHNDTFHFFDEFIIHGARTEDILEDMAMRGLFDNDLIFNVYGDATGAARSTNSVMTDWDIIEKYLNNYRRKDDSKIIWNDKVPRSNPPVRDRHNVVNAYCENALSERRLFIYENCKIANDGMKTTALKKGAAYIEDDSKEEQHVTTAIGYFICEVDSTKNMTQARNF